MISTDLSVQGIGLVATQLPEHVANDWLILGIGGASQEIRSHGLEFAKLLEEATKRLRESAA